MAQGVSQHHLWIDLDVSNLIAYMNIIWRALFLNVISAIPKTWFSNVSPKSTDCVLEKSSSYMCIHEYLRAYKERLPKIW